MTRESDSEYDPLRSAVDGISWFFRKIGDRFERFFRRRSIKREIRNSEKHLDLRIERDDIVFVTDQLVRTGRIKMITLKVQSKKDFWKLQVNFIEK